MHTQQIGGIDVRCNVNLVPFSEMVVYLVPLFREGSVLGSLFSEIVMYLVPFFRDGSVCVIFSELQNPTEKWLCDEACLPSPQTGGRGVR